MINFNAHIKSRKFSTDMQGIHAIRLMHVWLFVYNIKMEIHINLNVLLVMQLETFLAMAYIAKFRKVISESKHEYDLLMFLAKVGIYEYAVIQNLEKILMETAQEVDFQTFVLESFSLAEFYSKKMRKNIVVLVKYYVVPVSEVWERLYGPLSVEDRQLIKLLVTD